MARKGRWKKKKYSKQIMEYANHSMRDDERRVYKELFNALVERHQLTAPEDLMLLDTVVYDFIRTKRIQRFINKEGDVYKFTNKNGETYAKSNEASYLLNAVETQLRNNMKELQLTKKEKTKNQLGMDTKSFDEWVSENTVEGKIEEKKNEQDEKEKS